MVFKKIRSVLNSSIITWMDNHNPVAIEHILHLRNLYIFPTRLGWAFLLLACVIWLLGTNYQNNLILSLAYFQLSLFIVCILHTYSNLAGLKIRFLRAEDVFSGEPARVLFSVISTQRKTAQYVTLYFVGNLKTTFNFNQQDESIEDILHPTQVRGRSPLQRLRIESYFPMGLLKCGSWLRFDGELLAYPKLVQCGLPQSVNSSGDHSGDAQRAHDAQEFFGFKQYVTGDALNTIAWKHLARGRGLYSLVFAEPKAAHRVLHYHDFLACFERETALSGLTYWVLQFYRQQEMFSVDLGGESVAEVSNDQQLATVLRALAVF